MRGLRDSRVRGALALTVALGLALTAGGGCATPGLAVGDRAPDFELLDQNGERVRLYELLAERAVVLFFYAADATPG